VTVRIRPFLNTDTPNLARIWDAHHLLAGIPGQFTESAWEYSVFGKLIFDPDGLLIAENETGAVGFVHAVMLEAELDSTASNSIGLLNALCVAEDPDQDTIARQLINAASDYLRQRGSGRVIATGSPDQFAYYLGVGDAAGLIGVASRDVRLQSWLEQSGFSPRAEVSSWQMPLANFRPPMDRSQIAIRRQGKFEILANPSAGKSWWMATILGHGEMFAFQLNMRQSGSIEKRVDFWQPEFTSLNTSGAFMHLMMPKITEEQSFDQYSFLISEALRHFQQGRIPRVRAAVYSDDVFALKLLERLNFRKDLQGTVFEKSAL
jgi:ribosomal protein S18 acetylase RimI-like enzyme